MGREKGEQEDWGELGGMGWLRWRKGEYGSREVDILIKGAILGLTRDLTLEWFQVSKKMSPACSLSSRGKGV